MNEKDDINNWLNPAALGALLNGDTENFMVAAAEGGIERQEEQGQKEFVQSDTLPKDCPRKELEAMGIVFGEETDDIFVQVTLPNDWTVVATEHSMWSDLLDDKNRTRASIFYKAAFYDRSAHMRLTKYITINRLYSGDSGYDSTEIRWNAVTAENVTIREEVAEGMSEKDSDYHQVDDLLRTRIFEWLTSNYPDFEDPLYGWDWND